MVVTVSTVKDSLDNVKFFVQCNLANGVDHMIIFLDASQPDVQQWLDEHPMVTCLTSESWWGSRRPSNLNRRQRINANAVKEALADCAWADWLFHIDADEVALLDREVLAATPRKASAIRLLPHEATSVHNAVARPTSFKRLLDNGELSLLQSLGVIREATNSLHFRSHIVGKVGVRPQAAGLHMRHHRVVTADGSTVEHHRAPGIGLLHYESWSGSDFVRKWTAMIGSGPSINFGKHRQVIADGIRSLLAKDLSPEVTQDYLARLYDVHMTDDVQLLRELDMLVEVDPREGRHQPRPLATSETDALTARLAKLASQDKKRFAPDQATPDPAPGSAPEPGRQRTGLFRRRS